MGIEDKQPITKEEVVRRQKRQRQFKPRQIYYDEVNSKNSRIGLAGELFVVQYERDRLEDFAPDDKDRVQHLSAFQGDGLGYDVASINADGSPIFIEVKTTVGGKDTPFYMSENERCFMELHKADNDAFIYRVYNFDEQSERGELIVISARDLTANYLFNPMTYCVYKKQ